MKKTLKQMFTTRNIVAGLIIGSFLGILTWEDEKQVSIFGFSITQAMFGKEIEAHNEEGRFYCWWINDVMEADSYQNFTDFQKDLFILHKKWCIDEPRPSPKGGLLVIND